MQFLLCPALARFSLYTQLWAILLVSFFSIVVAQQP
jgi:hypothetical protein